MHGLWGSRPGCQVDVWIQHHASSIQHLLVGPKFRTQNSELKTPRMATKNDRTASDGVRRERCRLPPLRRHVRTVCGLLLRIRRVVRRAPLSEPRRLLERSAPNLRSLRSRRGLGGCGPRRRRVARRVPEHRGDHRRGDHDRVGPAGPPPASRCQDLPARQWATVGWPGCFAAAFPWSATNHQWCAHQLSVCCPASSPAVGCGPLWSPPQAPAALSAAPRS